jgi:hypothetical protein
MPFRWLVTPGTLLLLAGCVAPGAAPDTLLPALQRYYAEHAVEEDGSCPRPELATITKRKVLSSSGEATVLRVRYSYFDASVDDVPDWQRVLIRERRCAGYGERDFTLVKRKTGYEVMAMSGDVRV